MKAFQGSGSGLVSVRCFGVIVSVMFHFKFVHYTFSQFGLLSGHLLGIAARSVSNLFSLYFVYLQYLFISRFDFKSGICLLFAPVPVHCFSIIFIEVVSLAVKREQ